MRSSVKWVIGIGCLLAACSTRPQQPQPIAYAPPAEPDVTITTRPAFDADLECLAKTIYFEARGESEAGQRAVAAVVLNRVKSPKFPNTVCEVVHQGGQDRRDCQFSWWCDGLSDEPKDKQAWVRAATIAHEMMNGAPDPTRGALYFHHRRISPAWGPQLSRLTTIGAHVYYR